MLTFLYFYLNYKQHPLRLDAQLLRHIRFDRQLSKIILRLGVPTGIQMITTSVAGLVIVGLVNRHGADATAAYGAVNQVLNYIQFPALSIAIAASIFGAQAIGAGEIRVIGQSHAYSARHEHHHYRLLGGLGLSFLQIPHGTVYHGPCGGRARATAVIYCAVVHFILWCQCHFCLYYAGQRYGHHAHGHQYRCDYCD